MIRGRVDQPTPYDPDDLEDEARRAWWDGYEVGYEDGCADGFASATEPDETDNPGKE